jgi:protoheme IX farnesyltransferase
VKTTRAFSTATPATETPVLHRSPEPIALPLSLPDRRTRSVMADYLALIKPRILVLLLITTLAAALIAASIRPPSGWEIVRLVMLTLLGGTLAAGGASALNQYLDRDIDALMARTRNRPLPAGRLEPRSVFVFGLALTVLSVIVFAVGVNLLSAGLALGGNLFYVLVYTSWLKRVTTQNIVIGGIAGAIPPLVGWAAVRNDIELPGILLFVIITLWTPPHFWSLSILARRDYSRAGIPMLPVVRGLDKTCWNILVYTLLLVASTLVLFPTGAMGGLYLGVALVLGAAFVVQAVALLMDGSQLRAKSLFVYSNIYLALLFAAMVADRIVALS